MIRLFVFFVYAAVTQSCRCGREHTDRRYDYSFYASFYPNAFSAKSIRVEKKSREMRMHLPAGLLYFSLYCFHNFNDRYN